MNTLLIGLSVVIQAGGVSKRMGQDKGLVGFRGQSLVQRLVERLSPIADEILVTTNNAERYHFLGVTLAGDLMPGTGALGGLYTALSAARHPAAAIVACDMPFASKELFKYEHNLLMATAADLVIPRTANGLEPFHAVYRRQVCLPYVRATLEAGERRVDAWFDKVKVRYIEPEEILPFDFKGRIFMNINTLEELYQAEKLASEESPHPGV
jgi:molybdopterin-guanine dinucleotide biosynthesis protein A